MTDPAMARLMLEGPKELKAITVNGQIIVETEDDRERKRAERAAKRKSRWDTGSNNKGEKHVAPGMSTIVNVERMGDEKAQEIYLLNLQIREITAKMGTPTLGIPLNPRDRSPSPEPIYNSKGVRVNTRIERQRVKLQNQRNTAITKLKVLDPTYDPPACMKYKNGLLEQRIEVPQEEYPQYNFMGLILGPRGHYISKLQERTRTRIGIKGKGSLKAGMTGLKKDGTMFDYALHEPMHIMVNGEDAAGTKEAADFLRKLIKEQVEDPDGPRMVALRASHMHDLQVLNGTLREMDLKCLNCGGSGHKTWECPDHVNVTSSTICGACGGVGHVTRDCKNARPGQVWNEKAGGAEFDSEFEAFMNDMGGGAPKKQKVEEDKPYVPPMGDPASRLFGGGSSKPRLMLTDGSSAPGAAVKKAKKLTAMGGDPGLISGRSIFGGTLNGIQAGLARQAEVEKERREEAKKHEDKMVPTEWQAELQDKRLEEKRERLMMELEHAKLMAKIAKKKEERAIQASAPPPPPCTVIPEPVDPSCPLASISIEDLRKACLAKGLDSSGTRAAITARLKASNAKKPAPATPKDPVQIQSTSKPVADPWASLNINQLQVECLKVGLPSKGSREALIQRLKQSGNVGKQLNINGPSPTAPKAHTRLGPGNGASVPPPPGPGFTWNGVCWEREVD